VPCKYTALEVRSDKFNCFIMQYPLYKLLSSYLNSMLHKQVQKRSDAQAAINPSPPNGAGNAYLLLSLYATM
jgi:hypothetical protein